jgi:hypothetical protein
VERWDPRLHSEYAATHGGSLDVRRIDKLKRRAISRRKPSSKSAVSFPKANASKLLEVCFSLFSCTYIQLCIQYVHHFKSS